ncbi:MAG: FHA domain-containing protein [Planctomycetes bacterium]|nr:FHA domain-containing protein [Planctomycetota bacterium]
MFPVWRLQLREARVAWQSGRYDEAIPLLTAESLRDFLPAKELARDVAGKMVERAGDRFARGDSVAGWHDLQQADRLGGQSEAINELRTQYADRVIGEARSYMLANQTAAAIALLDKLQRRGLCDERARLLRQVAQLMQEAERMELRGHFAEALAAVTRAAALAKPPLGRELGAERQATGKSTMDDLAARLSDEAKRLSERGNDCQRLTAEMHAALAAENWGAALTAADGLLAIAPQHAAAGQARRRAWKAVGMDVTQMYNQRRPAGYVSLALDKAAGHGGRRSTRPGSRSNEDDTVAGNEHPQRALLWIDAVGGFLVCMDDCVVLGQPSPGNVVAVPILADLSRRHAVIRRDAGAYVLEPLQHTRVDGREITGPHVLADNQLIQLGDNVRVRFSKPHALSATARLVIESHHKTQPSADAVLLMADSCVLGPSRHCHVRCRDWKRDIVVYRQNDRVLCRADEPLAIDGVQATGESEIQSGVRVEGEEFSFTWETIA